MYVIVGPVGTYTQPERADTSATSVPNETFEQPACPMSRLESTIWINRSVQGQCIPNNQSAARHLSDDGSLQVQGLYRDVGGNTFQLIL